MGENYDEKHAAAVKFIEDNLKGFDFGAIEWTSDPTPWDVDPDAVYNCFGHAVGFKRFWQPPSIHGDFEGDPRFYWPPELLGGSGDNTWVHRYVEAAKTLGFDVCGDDSSWEPSFEKIVLIHSGGVFTHASLQVSETRWSSKLGDLSDFQHPLESVLRKPFGRGAIFMKRGRQRG
ncbi:MAG TPA: hypothetical protein VHY37_13095 [Tepidisphaeraceae bacterium]|nr:hypothetical protein [Tepidisphaeraceae bacterium]